MKPNLIVIHCSDSSYGDARLIEQWHLERGFEGIGYHYVILNGSPNNQDAYDVSRDGVIQAGRAETKQGAHALGVNAHSLGICLIGVDHFTFWQFSALARLLRGIRERRNIPLERIIGHYEVARNKTCPNIDMKRFRNILNELSRKT